MICNVSFFCKNHCLWSLLICLTVCHYQVNGFLSRSNRIISSSSSVWQPCFLYLGDGSEDGNSRGVGGGGGGGSSQQQQMSSLRLLPGLAGFAATDDGFVGILSSQQNQQQECNNIVPLMITINDSTERVSSPEALCLLQLAAGLDLGTAIFPPNALTQIILDDFMADDDDDEDSTVMSEGDYKICGTIHMQLIDASNNYDNDCSTSLNDSTTKSPDETVITEQQQDTPERQEAIQQNANKMLPVLKNLPGCTDVTYEQICEGLHMVADSQGTISTRQNFSELLNYLRRGGNITQQQQQLVQCQIPIQMLSDDTIRHITLPSPFLALALSMRYKYPIQLHEDLLQQMGLHDSDLMKQYPTFRSIQDIRQESQGAMSPQSILQQQQQQQQDDEDDQNDLNNDAFQ